MRVSAAAARRNEALRETPALQCKVVLKLTIRPEGRVASCEGVSSKFHDPDLARKRVQRVLHLQFEPREVETITLTQPIDLFPA